MTTLNRILYRLEATGQVRIDNHAGLGAVPYNEDVGYFGVKVLMTPPIFLRLAAPLSHPDDASIRHITQHLKNGGAIGAPFLEVDFMPNDLERVPRVMGHEGRHRMIAVQELYGRSVEVEVHLFPAGSSAGMRRRNITPEMIERARMDLCPEKKNYATFDGPYFEVVK